MSFAANKKVLVVTSHQDDESLFCGGLLSAIRDVSDVTIICMSGAKQPRDVVTRNRFFCNACKLLNARAITTDFCDARHVWSHVDQLFQKRPEQVATMQKFLTKQLDTLRPDIIITHNENGEYGHCYHQAVHRICRRVCDPAKLYFIGRGAPVADREQFTVEYDVDKKKQLMACYPSFNAISFSKRFFRGKVITYEPETYVSCGPREPTPAVASGLRLYAGLTSRFLHFFDRKIRSELGWC